MTQISTNNDTSKIAGLSFTDAGRIASIVGGGALAIYGLANGIKNRSIPSIALAAFGGGMLYKAASERMAASVDDAPALPYRGGIVVAKSITINKPAAELYAFWQKLENLPTFMEHLISVKSTGEKTSHWVAKGPAGIPVEWDAEIINEIDGDLIAWRSIAPSNIDNAGSVRFTPDGDSTVVKVVFRYDPPGRYVGAALATLFGDEPGQQVEEDLFRLKQLMETGSVSQTMSQGILKTAARDMNWPKGENPVKDHVEEASEDSFPASDPPSNY